MTLMKKKTDEPLEALQKQIEEWKGKYLRALADYQNLEKRKNEEIRLTRHYAGEILLTKLLPVVDTFKRSLAHIKDPGLELAVKELEAFLTDAGVKKIDVVGKPFNPHEMECIEVIDGEDNIVIEETLPGITLHGKVIRVAQVKVGKKKGENYG
ncbi:nucleotide exchange factor GrpE [Candidatus Gottesmanbacteria bacterium RIFCSPLOWO2_01_FULL_49_10]|uniref:Protein GrpE n=1 Tax=Candidatus Gottesmanbacteria bacterium RIFCSPLOWO2_01_FULL_49_10 TaxID=1798396 RepID=A0A1F6B1I5_9BACT|nr:MAG: Protein GrpE [Microgenomates group bacterium GW2011_GWA2_47_8]OGG30778.1 MAG: nucleotide exchange factor GrpE [Candidatus Gottesmanbacteria bacterium RIFCSPLOWO2_01_FULL_49_10]